MSLLYEAAIGLEIHAELATQSKIFCGCQNAFGALPNTLCCPVCTGMPGALPVLNRQVVEYAAKVGLAMGCTVNTRSQMDRKHYFYPDLPKAYQISQQARPLCENGHFEVWVNGASRAVGISRVHMEEDAGKLVHQPGGGSLIDYNRCGVPLIEIVTGPDLRGADESKAMLEQVARLLRYLGVSDVKMQEGSMRADVNVSLRPVGQTAYGTRCEMKNVNSFMAVHRAIRFEIARQAQILQAGGTVAQETRRWDDAKGESIVLRGKEEAQDYRYFPEPDLPPVVIEQAALDALAAAMPELPAQKLHRYRQAYGLSAYEADLLCAQPERARFFEQAVAEDRTTPKAIANWLLGDVARLLNARKAGLALTALTPKNLAELLALVDEGVLSGTAAKQVLEELLEQDAPPGQIVQQLGLAQVSDDGTLLKSIRTVLVENSQALADYAAGKTNAFGYLVGQCMKASGGKANPQRVRALLAEEIARIQTE